MAPRAAMDSLCLVTVVGPTAVGKSRLALQLAQGFNGEILSADSRQVYRYMDIGTAKPTAAERALVPHHLIDIVNPDEPCSVALYQEQAQAAIGAIAARGHLPVVVGGSGLFVWALLRGFQLPRVPPNWCLRRELERQAALDGAAALHRRLRAVDPFTAEAIDPHNVRRVIRALEIYQATGRLPSEMRRAVPAPYRTLVIGLTLERPELYRRIDQRVEEMMARGLVDEVRQLVAMGYGFQLPAMSGLGYRQMGMYLRGEVSLAEAVEKIKYGTHRFARHQYAWFRLNDPAVSWLPANAEGLAQAAAEVREFLVSQHPA